MPVAAGESFPIAFVMPSTTNSVIAVMEFISNKSLVVSLNRSKTLQTMREEKPFATFVLMFQCELLFGCGSVKRSQSRSDKMDISGDDAGCPESVHPAKRAKTTPGLSLKNLL